MDCLVGVFGEGVEGALKPPAVGQGEVGVDLENRHEHEATGRHFAVRQGQPVGAVLEVAEQQQIDVDQPRGMPRPAGLPALFALD